MVIIHTFQQKRETSGDLLLRLYLYIARNDSGNAAFGPRGEICRFGANIPHRSGLASGLVLGLLNVDLARQLLVALVDGYLNSF